MCRTQCCHPHVRNVRGSGASFKACQLNDPNSTQHSRGKECWQRGSADRSAGGPWKGRISVQFSSTFIRFSGSFFWLDFGLVSFVIVDRLLNAQMPRRHFKMCLFTFTLICINLAQFNADLVSIRASEGRKSSGNPR